MQPTGLQNPLLLCFLSVIEGGGGGSGHDLCQIAGHPEMCKIFKSFDLRWAIEMANPGEVSQILSGITFDRNNIF